MARLPPSLPLWPLPLACALLCLLASHLSYLLAAALGQLPGCLPYGLDCVSISATGRQTPSKLLFKPLLTLGAAGLLVYWWLMAQWLRQQGLSGRQPGLMAWLGGLGALCLVAYTAALGEGGDSAWLLRRLGAVLGFSFSFLAQLLLSAALRQSALARPEWAVLRQWLWALIIGLLLLGLLSAFSALFPWHERVDDGFEWWLALLLQTHLALTAGLWRQSAYRLQLRLG